MKALFCDVGEMPKVVEIKDYKDIQKYVKGYFDFAYYYDDVDLAVNDEGKLIGMDVNYYVVHGQHIVDTLNGPVLVVAHKGSKTVSLTDEQIKKYTQIMSNFLLEI